MSHWYDSTPKKSRRKRDSNPGSSAFEADALTTRPTRPLLLRSMQVPCPNFKKTCTPLCEDGTLLCCRLLLENLALPGISYYLSQGRYLIHISSSWWSLGLEDDIFCASYLWVREWLCRPILDLQSRVQSGHWKFAFVAGIQAAKWRRFSGGLCLMATLFL